MAYQINAAECTACGSCEAECPNEAICLKKGVYWIDPAKCKECEGAYDTPHCADLCPVGACVPLAA